MHFFAAVPYLMDEAVEREVEMNFAILLNESRRRLIARANGYFD
jgi:hypothetical protein